MSRRASGRGGKSGARGGGGPSRSRTLRTRVKTAKGRTISSTRWLERQLNDPYVAAAREQGFRSRAAFKLIEIDEKFRLLKPGMVVLDLGAAPGGWSQYASGRVRAAQGEGSVVALDLLEIEPIPGVVLLQCDFLDADATARLRACIAQARPGEAVEARRVDAVISDLAASASGHQQTDHLRIIGLCEDALAFAREVLKPEGMFLAKVLQGGATKDLLVDLKQDFASVRHVKPAASRADSSELFVLATGFRGVETHS